MKWYWYVIMFIIIAGVWSGLIWYFGREAKINATREDTVAAENQNDNSNREIPAPTPQEKEASFLFTGDMMFDRFVNHTFKTTGFDHIFDNFDKSLFSGKDITFGNLEGPVSSKAIIDDYPDRSLVFNMPPETIATLKNLGINGVSLANNHTLNAGASGLATTRSLLANAGLKHGGSQNGFDEASVVRYETEIPISIVTVDYLAFNNLSEINVAIKKEKDLSRFVIVFPHWGTEYDLKHSASQRQAAKSFIGAGADLIIGNHPHVIQDVEIIDNVPVFYALGNFVFDQTFSKDTQEGIVLAGTIKEKSLEINISPFRSTNLKPALMNEQDKKVVLDRINNGAANITLDR